MVRNFLKLATFNVGSLVNVARKVELNRILIDSYTEIAFLQELHLAGNKNVYLDNFITLRDKSNLGVAIAVRDYISFSHVTISNISFPNLFIIINASINGIIKRILCGSIYIPSNCCRQLIRTSLSLILHFSQNYDGLILGGDLNAKHFSWGDVSNNFNGDVLFNWLSEESVSVTRICDSYPTYPGGSSHLDHFIVSTNLIDNINTHFETCTLPTFSDHLPLGLCIHFPKFNFLLRTPNRFISFKETNWNNFKIDLSYSLLHHYPPIYRNLSNIEIDYFIEEFVASVNFITKMHSKETEFKKKHFIVSDKVKKLLKIKYGWQKDLKRIFTRTLNRNDPLYLQISKQIDLLKIIIKEQIEIEQCKMFNDKLRVIKPGPWAYRKIFNIIGNRKRCGLRNISVNGVEITDLTEKLIALKDHFGSIYLSSPPIGNISVINESINNLTSNITNTINFDSYSTSLNNQCLSEFIVLDDILTICKSINNNKSCGLDNISNYLIRRFPIKAFEYLTILYNNCLNNSYFPHAWKVAKIIPIPKQRDINDINNLRPISLLSNLGKIFERVIREKMDSGLNGPYIPQNQFGFKKGNSTVHALLKFHSDVVQNLREGRCTVAVSLDVEKAFDKAYHNGILFKMISIGFKASIIKMFKSFFEDRKFCVQVDGTSSSFGSVKCGVPQGSVLAPLLYNIFVHDFPVGLDGSKSILYADDSLLYAHDESPVIALQRVTSHLNLVYNFYSSWGIKINASKSSAICLRNPSGKCKYTVVPESKRLRLLLHGNEILFKDSIKYLGVNFNKLFKFNKHVDQILKKANRVKGVFARLFNSKFLPIRSKLLLYKVSIRPILLYAFPIWFTISKTMMKKLEIFERHIVRKCIELNYKSRCRRFSNEYIYEKASLLPISDYAFILTRKFVERLSFFEGDIIQEILSSERRYSWFNTNYISPIGILQQQANDIPGRNFSLCVTPGIHRG